jgi:hypothetical protein
MQVHVLCFAAHPKSYCLIDEYFQNRLQAATQQRFEPSNSGLTQKRPSVVGLPSRTFVLLSAIRLAGTLLRKSHK